MNDVVQLPILEAASLGKTYADGKLQVEVLKDVNLVVNAGEMTAIIGASGVGKSTLLHLLGGLDVPSDGIVKINGNDINKMSTKEQGLIRNRYLGFVYQFHHLLPEFDALENVCMPLLIRGNKPAVAREKGRRILDKVELSDRITHRVGELSGGERQRVAIARALVTEPVCVLADEPTGNLDQKTAERVFDIILNLNKELNIAFIVVTHNEKLADRYCQRSLVIANKSIS